MATMIEHDTEHDTAHEARQLLWQEAQRRHAVCDAIREVEAARCADLDLLRQMDRSYRSPEEVACAAQLAQVQQEHTERLAQVRQGHTEKQKSLLLAAATTVGVLLYGWCITSAVKRAALESSPFWKKGLRKLLES